ncbi:hypothetical protein SJ05684_c15400 [Sinorhizobium sojae CCBAU 05684]|uniref:Uncharacterized protein n=1 Tax=Sinorhizobium sojae CCBAU 05684 TaxID=716928 RepID=A0A249PB42_9HYPH|nr:hypothetical protein SJ05684_c15400 [Sinorhizobium sojae CCBAU 05684]
MQRDWKGRIRILSFSGRALGSAQASVVNFASGIEALL